MLKTRFLIIFLFFLNFICLNKIDAADKLVTEFKLQWEFSSLPIEVRTILGPLSEKKRVSETGIVNDSVKLPLVKEIDNSSVQLREGESAIVYLLVKNKSKKTIRFSVAPHSTEPGESALGFSFSCLCNGHIYEVPAGKVWYRIMSLKNKKEIYKDTVILKHTIFQVKK